ncbi:MAG: FAD-dependent oxidoreductase [Betaproteobacteria bacterium]|nr:FAD-dependent oxidoreductase [Betaproteobacteria bacterium]
MNVPHESGTVLRWPYAVRYGTERDYEADVLVIGGGIAGVWAAIAAASTGAKVIVLEKAATERSGAGGPGVDHWQWAADNPGSRISPEELAQALVDNQGGYRSGISTYIQCASAWETLEEMERMGGKIRDTGDEFRGAEFRDEKTKLLYAYDYTNRFVLRVWGHNFKPLMREQCRRLGIRVFDRVAVTSILTEGGRPGARVVGAAGVHCHSGAYVAVRAKAVVLATNRPKRIWTFSSELRGITTFRPPSCSGTGYAIAYRAGAEFAMMEKSMRSSFASPYAYPPYGSGNAINTWYPCTIVDANGKEVPWVDAWGRPVSGVAARCRPVEGQKFFIMGGGSSSQPHPGLPQHLGPKPIPDLEARMLAGEFVPPFYADLAGMPEMERKAIWGIMVGNEGKTRIPVMKTYMASGFDPERDMLQSYDFLRGHGMREPVLPQERTFGEQGVCGGMLVDWDLMSNLPGLFGAGDLLFGGQDHSHAAASGRFAGARAALHARRSSAGEVSLEQIEREKKRVYAPLACSAAGPDWKELNAAVARVMQNYCSELKNAELLSLAKTWLDDLQANEVPRVSAGDPHQLMRVLEVHDIVTCAQMIVSACEARKASSAYLHFNRRDYPQMDPAEWHKWLVIRKQGEDVAVSDRPIAFWGDFESNYRPRHAENAAAMASASQAASRAAA